MIIEIRKLCELFMGACKDTETMKRIVDICLAVEQRKNTSRYRDAKPLFDDIRHKSLDSTNMLNSTAQCQYIFEEKCAKSLYNMHEQYGGFDADSPFYIIPCALELGRKIGIPDERILEIVT